jgi:hypothetical protein
LALVPYSRRTLATVVALVTSIALAGCTSHAKSTPTAPATAASGAALAELRAQLAAAAGQSFTATYAGETSDPSPITTTIRVFRTPSQVRLDVDEQGATIQFFFLDNGSFLCRRPTGAASAPAAGTSPPSPSPSSSPSASPNATTPVCVTLARPGQQLPVDPAFEYLFTSEADSLAQATTVSAAPAGATSALPTSGLPTSAVPTAAATTACYSIAGVPATSKLAAGTYCYSHGVLVSARFRASSLKLISAGPAPSASDFTVPASPVPLASGSPAAS